MQQSTQRIGNQRKKLRIAFRIFKEGIYRHEYKGSRGNVLWDTGVEDDEGKTIFIQRKDINSYLDETFWSAYIIWCRTENLGCLPFSGGWAEQPAAITEVINLFKVEQSKWEAEQMEKKK